MTDPFSTRKHVTYAGSRPEGHGLECPACSCPELRVVYTRQRVGYVARVRECGNDQCGHRITTRESQRSG